jgi:hypothetical protein
LQGEKAVKTDQTEKLARKGGHGSVMLISMNVTLKTSNNEIQLQGKTSCLKKQKP